MSKPHPFTQQFGKPKPRSRRTRRVSELFGLRFDEDPPQTGNAEPPPLPEPGQIMFVGGPSGGGKSTLLRQLIRSAKRRKHLVLDVGGRQLPNRPAVDCLPDMPVESALALLGKAGLGEAWCYLRRPSELSDGQRWRLRLAVAVDDARRLAKGRTTLLVCDEFAALLDRVTAAVVARSLRKMVDGAQVPIAAILVTSHDDLHKALAPDIAVRCDFGQVSVTSTSTRST
ncbi:MAG: AAA family ATPase [Planctomycetota bacterium]